MITSFRSVRFENDNFGDVRPEGNMGGLYEVCVRLFRLFTVLHFVGKNFPNLFGFTLVVKYVYGDNEEFVIGKRNRLDGDDAFVRETESLLCIFPELSDIEVRLAEYFLSVLEIDFWYDRSTSTVKSRLI